MSLSGDQVSGRNSGSMTLAMNSTVINGTPRTISMNNVLSKRTAGISERLPSASTMPIGSDVTMPTAATTMVTVIPPQNAVSTVTSPNGGNPCNRANDATGSTMKK